MHSIETLNIDIAVFIRSSKKIQSILKLLFSIVIVGKSGIFGHPVEDRFLVSEQTIRRVKLLDQSCVQDHDPGAVQDGVQPVGDGEDGAVEELGPDCGLDEVVRLEVDGRGGFVQNENFRFAEKSSSETDKLSLTDTEKLII